MSLHRGGDGDGALGRGQGDVAAVVAARKTDPADRLVGALPGGGQGGAGADDGQDPAAGGDQAPPGVPGGAGVEDVDALDPGGLVEALDDPAGLRVRGVAGCGDDHGDRGVVVPGERGHLVEATLGRG